MAATTTTSPVPISITQTPVNSSSMSTRWHESPPTAVENQTLLASGSGADVFEGVLHTSSGAVKVALRRPRIVSSAALERFEEEVALRSCLSHPHILPLISACTVPPSYCTVSPLVAGGDLFTAIHVRGARFDFSRTLRLASQIASGMAYLHAAKIVHRDLKSANILVDRDLSVAYVADLDLAVRVDDLHARANIARGRALQRGPSNGRLAHMVGTLVYMAPEVLCGAPHGYAADVYAFAVLMNEVASATVPFLDRELPEPELHTVLETRFNDVTLRRAIVSKQLRPVPACRVPPEFSSLLTRSWHADPSARPTFPQIAAQLDQLVGRGEEYISSFPAAAAGDFTLSKAAEEKGLQCATSGNTVHGQDVQNENENDGLVAELTSIALGSPSPPTWFTQSHHPYNPPVVGALSSTCGERGEDRMEDTALVVHNLSGLPHAHLFAVFDGHGGTACSLYAAETLPAAIFRNWSRPGADPISVLVRAFRDTDAAFLISSPPMEQSGCTVVAALVLGASLFVANAGDCRCVVGMVDGNGFQVTKDHLAADPDEKARVQARGGHVDQLSGRVEGRLMVSRAIGDRSLKRYVPATPDVFSIELTPDHDFFILASDGLWDVVGSEEAVSLVKSTARSADLAAKRLALKAIELGSDDNISVIVVFTK